MKNETKNCQNCKKDFIVEPEDFNFYEKIKVPPPTFCPECRMIRRMAFRDYRVLYKRKSDKTGNIIFSVFHPSCLFKIWERDIWWSDAWNSLDYGKEIDFSKPFFEQMKELFLKVPQPSQTTWDLVNSEYCSGSNNLKNCYLVFVSTNDEDCMYGAEINNTKNSLDVTRIESSELCYESFALTKCYKTFFSSHCENCIDIYFSRNLAGCNSCFGCTNLRNKNYYTFNEKYSKEEYEKIIKSFNLGSYISFKKIKSKTDDLILKSIRKFTEGRYNQNVSGEYINNSKNVLKSYYVTQGEDSKYLQIFFTPNCKNCYDCSLWGQNSELCYEASSVGSDCYDVKFCYRCSKGSQNCEYSFSCYGCSNVFGCSSLRNKQYCILNKQYSKEEYFVLKNKIIEHMKKMPYKDQNGIIYKYGEFFPGEFSPFCYNESAIREYVPLSKDEVLKQGYKWLNKEERNYKIDLENKDIPDNIKDADELIINKVLECENKGKYEEECTEAFKIVESEFFFYKKNNLPLPRLCPNCRHKKRIQMRNPMKLWYRHCMKEGCPNEFETSYSPDRPEIIYCEKCYQQEVY